MPSLTPSVHQVREYLPGNDFKEVVEMLHKMYNFMKMTALGTISSSKGLKVGRQFGTGIKSSQHFCSTGQILAKLMFVFVQKLMFVFAQATDKIIKYLEKIDAEPVEEDEEEASDYTLFNVSKFTLLYGIFHSVRRVFYNAHYYTLHSTVMKCISLYSIFHT